MTAISTRNSHTEQQVRRADRTQLQVVANDIAAEPERTKLSRRERRAYRESALEQQLSDEF